jgi:hypothetical protein
VESVRRDNEESDEESDEGDGPTRTTTCSHPE